MLLHNDCAAHLVQQPLKKSHRSSAKSVGALEPSSRFEYTTRGPCMGHDNTLIINHDNEATIAIAPPGSIMKAGIATTSNKSWKRMSRTCKTQLRMLFELKLSSAPLSSVRNGNITHGRYPIIEISTPRSRRNSLKGSSLAALVDVPAEPSIWAGRYVMVCFRFTDGDMVFLGFCLECRGTRAMSEGGR